MNAVEALALSCHRRIDQFPTVIGVSTTCTAQAVDEDVVANGMHTVTVCAPPGATPTDLSSLPLLYVGDDSSSGCGDVTDSFSYLALALPSSAAAPGLGSGLALAQYAHSALVSVCGGDNAPPCPWVTASLLGKFLLSASVVSAPYTVTLALAPSNALPLLGTPSSPSIQLTGAGYVVTDRDVHETQASGQQFFTNVNVWVRVGAVDLPGSGAPRGLASPPTGVLECFAVSCVFSYCAVARKRVPWVACCPAHSHCERRVCVFE
jgi:hypothetical protein